MLVAPAVASESNRQKGWTFADDFTFTNFIRGRPHAEVRCELRLDRSHEANTSADVSNATYSFAVTPAGIADTPFQIQFPNLNKGYTASVGP